MITFDKETIAPNTQIARIKVLGIGGAGGNTINHMIKSKYDRVEFIAANTDAQALAISQASVRLQLGKTLTRGLGAGANPDVGRKAAEEDLESVLEHLQDADIVFLVAGFGGGTGSGATPVIASALKELDILSVAVVTKPFAFEGKKSMRVARDAIEQLSEQIDTLVVIPNERLLSVTNAKVSMLDAFGMVNEVIHQFVRSIADIIAQPGHINVDFADVSTIMRGMGKAVMGTGRATGVDRAQKAAAQAIDSPLLEDTNIEGARAILLNITGGPSLGLHELHAAASAVHDIVAEDANIIMGSVIDESMGDEVAVTIIATGIEPRKGGKASSPAVRATQESSQTGEHVNASNGNAESDDKTTELEVPTYLRREQEQEREDHV